MSPRRELTWHRVDGQGQKPQCPNNCPCCGQEIIHKGSRNRHESSSLLGQIIHDYLPQVFTWMDADGIVWRGRDRLLRILEQKSPWMKFGPAQRALLELLATAIKVATPLLNLHRDSGVFIVWCEPTGRHGNRKLGACKMEQVGTPNVVEFTADQELDALCWFGHVDGADRDEAKRRLQARGAQQELESPK